MWGNNPYNYGGGMGERRSDNFIQNFVPGGLNMLNIISCYLFLRSMGERLDNMIDGNPNPTPGQIYGGAPGVGGYSNMVNKVELSGTCSSVQRNRSHFDEILF
ncbi:unnamed protein product [Rotaria sp. Silwood1]|nr:unnamed protein product [Rotaria sp. Silwood1]CAF3821281.1 unnamed protein product [Rotaria sp. Silwood1]CAF4809675.1 unnamed protein product [Rotaria sp. Silwood1]CAF4870972.1 unnamed protein product [Rotaria sp. Silwood1]